MDVINDTIAWYTEFIDKTNQANIDSGISLHCLTMGGLFGGLHQLYTTLHDEGAGALFTKVSSLLFGSNGDGMSQNCMERIIDADIRTVISVSAASAISSLSIFRICSPFQVVKSFTYTFIAEFLKLVALKNTLLLYGRRLFPSEAFVTGIIAGTIVTFIFHKHRARWLRGAVRGGLKELTSECLTRALFYFVTEGAQQILSRYVYTDDSVLIKLAMTQSGM